jgi:hypothetical protein
VALLLTAAAFTAGGIWMGLSGEWIGFLIGGFFALGIPVAVLQLIPGSAYLHVDQTGFTFSSSFRKATIPWSVVDEFFVVTLRQHGVRVHSMVGFNFVPSYDRSRLGREFAKAVSRCEAAFPCTYGKKAQELAEFMNSCLAKAKSSGAEEGLESDAAD